MPQMSPLYWLLIMLIIMMTLLILNSMIYFNNYFLKMKTNIYKNMPLKNKWNWKW